MDSNGLLNIYEQYYEANLKYGFYLREHTWQSIGKVLFIAGVQEGSKLTGNPPYFTNPKVFVKLYYANSISEIDVNTRSRTIRINDGGTYRYQPVDLNFKMPSKEDFEKKKNSKKFFDGFDYFNDDFLKDEK